jgi:hypothetical protein
MNIPFCLSYYLISYPSILEFIFTNYILFWFQVDPAFFPYSCPKCEERFADYEMVEQHVQECLELWIINNNYSHIFISSTNVNE